jgi:hypothetical protein
MIALITILAIENAFLSWLFQVAPLTASVVIFIWAIWRVASAHSNSEARFTSMETRISRIEVDIDSLKTTVSAIDSRLILVEGRLGRVEGRLDGLEGQLRIVIDLLREKKSIA